MKKTSISSAISVFAIMIVVVGIYLCVFMRDLLSDNRLFFDKAGIHVEGDPGLPKEGGFRLDYLVMDLTKVDSNLLNDIWVELRCGEKTKLTALTFDLWKEHYKDKCNFSFSFDQEGRLIELHPDTGRHHDVHGVIAGSCNPRMGSFSTGKSVVFPCSIPEFESVFGKADKMGTGFSW